MTKLDDTIFSHGRAFRFLSLYLQKHRSVLARVLALASHNRLHQYIRLVSVISRLHSSALGVTN